MHSETKKFIHIVILLCSSVTAITTFFIFMEGTSLSTRLVYALLIGFSAWMMISIFVWTIVIMYYSAK